MDAIMLQETKLRDDRNQQGIETIPAAGWRPYSSQAVFGEGGWPTGGVALFVRGHIPSWAMGNAVLVSTRLVRAFVQARELGTVFVDAACFYDGEISQRGTWKYGR
eukprot:7429076-Pyramimonas_sp.AAC.1